MPPRLCRQALAQSLAEGQTIALELPEQPLAVRADAGRLEQVVLNLLTNAIRYAQNTERIDLRLRSEGESAVIEVQDYGPGIPAAVRADLFSPFYQGPRQDRPSQDGLGLGLFIASELVRAHGGAISVESEEGRGATFRVRLPRLEGGS